MSKNSKKQTGKTHTHRPLHPTAANIDSIKSQFVQHISNKVVVQGANLDPKAPEKEVSDEQLHKEAEQQRFYTFPSGLICEWVSNPARPGIYVIVVNLEEDATKEPRPGFFATCRQPEVAQMLCDGVNFLMKCQKQMAEVGAGEELKPTILGPVVLPAAAQMPASVDDSTPTDLR
jgi:hypothetical protein